MRVYLAAPYAARDLVKNYADELTRIGVTFTSTWLTDTNELTTGALGPANDLDDITIARHIQADFDDIDKADTLVLFTATALPDLPVGKTTSGGRHVETGYFIANHGTENVIVVGPPENVFHRARDIFLAPDWHEAVIELSHRLVQAERDTPRAG